MGRPTGTKTATKGLLVAERRRKAWKLKLEGLTYEEIGRRLGVSNAQTHRDIHHRLDELDEEERQEAKAFRRAIVERDEAMIEALYPQARAGDLEATRGLLAVHRELRQVLGLDEPQRHEVAVDQEAAFKFVGPQDIKAGLRVLRQAREQLRQIEVNGKNGGGNGAPPS